MQSSKIGFVDRDKLEKIVSNLLSNAFNFTPDGGEIDVNLTPLHLVSPIINMGGIKEKLEITISNTGRGIPTDQLNQIFDRFYQVDNNYKKDREGTGIGLALTKELVEVCHGEISVSSIPDYMTTFTVTLPIAKEIFKEGEIIKKPKAGEHRPVEAKRRYQFVRKTSKPVSGIQYQESSIKHQASSIQHPVFSILIVEDNPDVTNYICSFMDLEYRVLTAENGKEGLKKTIEEYPDLIISDVMMPEMDGFELCEKIKSDERISHIPVILLTAKADLDSRIEGLEFGADDYVTKPFEAREIQIRAQNLIDQRRKLREKFSRLIEIKPGESTTSSMDEVFLERLLTIFESHFSESDFSTENFAREVGMSRNHLNRKLKALTDLSTHEFLLNLRLKRAAQLLKKRAGTVSEIAYTIGFNNPSKFARAFKIQYGCSPSAFSANLKD